MKKTVVTFEDAVNAVAELIIEDLKEDEWDSLKWAIKCRYIDNFKEYLRDLFEYEITGAYLDDIDACLILENPDNDWYVYPYGEFSRAVRKQVKAMGY